MNRKKASVKNELKHYFIAIIPPEPVFSEALSFKNYIKTHHDSVAALRSPPHVTLHMPFYWKEEKEGILIRKLTGFFDDFHPTKICLDNFGVFPPRVIFINVVANELLADLQKKLQRFAKTDLNLFNSNYREEPFQPHLTVAFRDLKKSQFGLAWTTFERKEYKAEFVADTIALLKHDGQRWLPHHSFPLKSSYSAEHNPSLESTEG